MSPHHVDYESRAKAATTARPAESSYPVSDIWTLRIAHRSRLVHLRRRHRLQVLRQNPPPQIAQTQEVTGLSLLCFEGGAARQRRASSAAAFLSRSLDSYPAN